MEHCKMNFYKAFETNLSLTLIKAKASGESMITLTIYGEIQSVINDEEALDALIYFF